jgi:hypothetical protein
MAKDPQERISSAEEVIRRLAPWTPAILEPLPLEESAPPSSTSSRQSMPRHLAPGAGQGEPPRRSPPLGLVDTGPVESLFLVQPAKEHAAPPDSTSASQLSLGTHPVASLSQETLPVFPEASMVYPASYRLKSRRGNSKQLIVAVAIAVGVGLLGILYLAIK